MDLGSSILTPVAAIVGALVGGGASLAAAIYKERMQHRLQRVTVEVSRREAVYADFVMSASHLLLSAHIQDEIGLNGDEQKLIGLINRMRLFAPQDVITGAEAVIRAIVDTMLKPSVELRELAKSALASNRGTDPVLAFSMICRADLDSLHQKIN